MSQLAPRIGLNQVVVGVHVDVARHDGSPDCRSERERPHAAEREGHGGSYPHQVLGRENLPERNETEDGCCERQQQFPASAPPASEEEPHREERPCLPKRADDRHRLRGRPRKVPRTGGEVEVDRGLVTTQPVRDKKDRAAQAFHVEGAPDEQPADVADAARRDDCERHHQHERGRREDRQVTEHVVATAPREDCQRDDGERVQLRGRAHAEGGKTKGSTFPQQGRERQHHQERGPEVEALEDEVRAERQRERCEDEYAGGEFSRAGARQMQGYSDKHDDRRAEDEHESAENGCNNRHLRARPLAGPARLPADTRA